MSTDNYGGLKVSSDQGSDLTFGPKPEVVKVAILLSTVSFETFYMDHLGLSYDAYINSYRNEWSWSYASGLAEQGVAITIYIPSLERHQRYQVENGVAIHFLSCLPGYRSWLKLAYFLRTPIGRYFAEVVSAKFFYRALRRALVEDTVDLLYIQEYWTGRFDFLARRINLPIIAGDHGGRGHGQLKWFKRQAFAAVDKITSQTPTELAEAQRYGADAVLLTNAVDTDFYQPAVKPYKPTKTILVVARFSDQQKRISDLIEALTYLGTEWRLQIAGSGPDEALYKAQVARLKLEHNVDFLGFVKDKSALLELYRRCGVFALVSSWEGLPLVVLEAMSSGAATVVTDIRAFEDIIENGGNGVKVGVGNIQEIVHGVQTAFARRDDLGRAARETVEARFSHRVVYAQLSEIIRQSVKTSKTTVRKASHGHP